MAADANGTPLGDLRRRAETLLEGQESDLESLDHHDLERLVHELQVHQIELELQNEALRETQLALAVARDEYAELYDGAPVGYITVDADGTIARANATAAALVRVERNALAGQPFRRLVARADQDAYHFFLVRLLGSGGVQTGELTLVRGDGTQFPARLEGRASDAAGDGRPGWRVAVSDVTNEVQARDLRLIVEGTAAVTGGDFFRALVQHLARLLAARVVLVGRLAGKDTARVHTFAVWADGGWVENFYFDLSDMACEQLARGEECFVPADASSQLPGDPLLARWPASGYRGLPLRDNAGQARGVLIVMDEAPTAQESRTRPILDLFAGRAAAEVAREEHRAALSRARDELDVRLYELAALQDLTQQVAATRETGSVLSLLADHLGSLIEYDNLVVYGLEGNHASVLEYRGRLPRDDALQAQTMLDRMPGVRSVVRRREPVVIADVQGKSPELRAWRREIDPVQKALLDGARSWLGVPLLVEGRVTGVLRLAHRSPAYYTERHARLALAFANVAALAIENARLHEQSRERAVVEERHRLARELHDAVSQTLFSASMIADVLPRLWEQNPEFARQSLQELRELMRGAQGEMRTLLWELRPEALLDTRLPELLRQLGAAVGARARVQVTVTVRGEGPLPPDVHLALYRIAQEALANVAKHARARTVTVSLASGDAQPGHPAPVELSIVDDGQGFDPEAIPHKGLGLRSLRERAEAIGASLSVTSAPGCGTQVRVEWPAAGQPTA